MGNEPISFQHRNFCLDKDLGKGEGNGFCKGLDKGLGKGSGKVSGKGFRDTRYFLYEVFMEVWIFTDLVWIHEFFGILLLFFVYIF